MKKVLIVSMIILLGCTLVLANEFEDAFKKAEQGDLNAQYDLGMMYKSGLGVPQNYKLAYIWFSLAAAKGHKDAVKRRDITEKKLGPQQLSEAQDFAVLQQNLISKLKSKSTEPIPPAKPIPNEGSVNGRFISNDTVGELFIITGQIENPSAILYSHIQVKGTLITKGKVKAKTQAIFCGNIISEEMLKTGNISVINKKLNLREGTNNSNVNVKPGESVPFMLVFSNLPDNLENFTVEESGFDISK